jgi:hypothetical protein
MSRRELARDSSLSVEGRKPILGSVGALPLLAGSHVKIDEALEAAK